jgi:uncharacterized membrane protein YjjP (DUF1212 family)
MRPLLEFLFRLGQAYLASGEQTAEIEQVLRRVASVNGATRPQVVVFPTAIFLSIHEESQETVTIGEGPTKALRLDQISDIYRLGDQARRGEIAPRDGLVRIEEIMSRPPRFGLLGAIGGHAVLSVGLAMVLMPTMNTVIATAILGAIVGTLKLLNRARPSLSVHLPVVSAALVSMLVFMVIKWRWPVDPLYVLIPPLVTFLPGARLTLGMVELAYGDMVSGSSRLMTGVVQLLLLAFGLTAGAMLVGYSAENLTDAAQDQLLIMDPHWAALLGVSLFTVGVYFHFSAPPNALPWMLLAVMVAFTAQQLASDFVGNTSSGFFGMLAVTPLCYLIQQRLKGPPAMVTYLPSFWILVPGALSLLGVKQMLSDREAGIDGLVTTTFAIVSIALGTLIGASIYKWFSDTKSWRRRQNRRFARWRRSD